MDSSFHKNVRDFLSSLLCGWLYIIYRSSCLPHGYNILDTIWSTTSFLSGAATDILWKYRSASDGLEVNLLMPLVSSMDTECKVCFDIISGRSYTKIRWILCMNLIKITNQNLHYINCLHSSDLQFIIELFSINQTSVLLLSDC